MQENAQFTFWESGDKSLKDEIADLFPEMSAQAFIAKKLKGYSTLRVEQLLSSKKLDQINGTHDPALYEVKIKGRMAGARFIAIRISQTGIRLLLIFKGSGSGGAVERWLPKARSRI